jgi:hypothetical protein
MLVKKCEEDFAEPPQFIAITGKSTGTQDGADGAGGLGPNGELDSTATHLSKFSNVFLPR